MDWEELTMARESGGGVGRLALLLAIVALLVAWAAYRREGGELRTLWADLSGGAGEKVRVNAGPDLQEWLARAKARLERRRADVAGQRNLEQVRKDVADLREKLKRSYRGAEPETQERWKSVDTDLERLQAELKAESSKALAELDATLEKIKREMAEEKEGQR